MDYELINPINKKLTEIEQILMNRGIPLVDVKHYLNTSNEDILPPETIDRIKEGAKLLIKHISANNKILMPIDADCDGFTSFAVFMNYLNNIFPAFVQNNIYYVTHNGKHHGIELDKIPEDTKLVIALDASSNEYDIHEALNSKNIDVLVIDHHKADKVSEYACVINNQLCDYPTKSLSGVGMVYKFCCYLDQLLGVNFAPQYLDLVALGLSADMMDLRDFETRHLITLGCENIKSPFIKKMMSNNEYQIKGELNPNIIGFYIAPYINAAARVGTPEETILLAEALLEYRAYEQIPSTKRGCRGQVESRVEQACRTCTNIKSRQTRLRDASLDFIENEIKTKNLLDNKILLIQAPKAKQLNTSLTGLMGNQIVSSYQRPTLILNERIHDLCDETGKIIGSEIWWEGSARGLERSAIPDFRTFLLNTNLVEYAEGHENAFGVGIKDCNIQQFLSYTNSLLKDIDFSPIYKVDFIYDADIVSPLSIISIGDYKYLWGKMVDEPLIVVKGVYVTDDNVSVMKGPSIKIIYNDIEFVKFKVSEEECEALLSKGGRKELTIIGKCDVNNWGGKITPQIRIEDFEITKHLKYYL